MRDDSPCPPGHNTPLPLKRSPPVSFKRLLGAGFRPPTDRVDRFSDEAPLRGTMPSRVGATDHLGGWRRGRAIVDGDVLASQESRPRARAIDVAFLKLDTGKLGHTSREGPPQPHTPL